MNWVWNSITPAAVKCLQQIQGSIPKFFIRIGKGRISGCAPDQITFNRSLAHSRVVSHNDPQLKRLATAPAVMAAAALVPVRREKAGAVPAATLDESPGRKAAEIRTDGPRISTPGAARSGFT